MPYYYFIDLYGFVINPISMSLRALQFDSQNETQMSPIKLVLVSLYVFENVSFTWLWSAYVSVTLFGMGFVQLKLQRTCNQ